MHTSDADIAHFKKRIMQKISHSYLHRFLGEPIIDEEKLSILISIMNRTALSPEQKDKYIVTTMLVQLALDTHDFVSNKHTADSQINKQLTVLAGDYYSGLYYFLLSEIDEYTMIRTLATAIKEINEYKMTLFYQGIKNENECIFAIKKIESLLFSHISSYLGLAPLEYPLEEWLLINKLMHEQKKLDATGTSPLLDEWFMQYPVTTVRNMLDNMIATQIDQLKNTTSFQTLNESPSMIKELLYDKHTPDVEEG